MAHLSDIEIAQAKKLQHITKIAEKLNISTRNAYQIELKKALKMQEVQEDTNRD